MAYKGEKIMGQFSFLGEILLNEHATVFLKWGLFNVSPTLR